MTSRVTEGDSRTAARRRPGASLVRVGFGLEALGRVCLRAPRFVLGLLVVVSVTAVLSARHVGFDDDLYEIYRGDSVEFTHYAMFSRLFPTIQDQVIAVFEGSDVTTREGLEMLRDVHLELEWVDGVLGASSVFSVRERARPGETPPAVIPADIPDGAALDALLQRVYEHPLAGRRLLSLDPPATLMSVALDPGQDPFDVAPRVEQTVRDLVANAPEGLDISVRFTGAPLLRLEILNSLRRDQAVLNGVGTIVSFLVCLTFFGRWRYVVTAVIPGLIGVLWTIGSFAAVGQPINIMNSVLPTLVTVIAMADALHMTSAVRRGLGDGLTSAEAARRAVDEVGPACAMTMLTTALVFFSLTMSSSVAIRDFGFAGAFAALLAFIAVITIVPCLSVVLMRRLEGQKTGAGAGGFLLHVTAIMTAVAVHLVSVRPRTITIVGSTMLALATVAYFSVEPSYTYREFLPDRSDANKAIDRIDTLFTGADTVHVLVIRTQGAPADAPRPAEVVRAVHKVTGTIDGLSNVESLATVEEWLARDLSDWAENAGDADEVGLPPHVAARFRAPDQPAWLVTASLPAVDASESVPIFDRLDAALDKVRAASPGYDIFVTGVVPMTARSGIELIGSLNLSLIAAIVVTMALIGFALRSVVTGLLVAIPNLLPLAVVGAALYLSDMGMQITSVVALTIAFGIAVDDTVHLVHRWQIERRSAGPREAAILALEHVGPVLAATTMVLVAGMISTVASALPMVRLFGMLCMLTFVAAVIADLLLMPALLVTFSGFISRRAKE